jgi:hypothetical protein
MAETIEEVVSADRAMELHDELLANLKKGKPDARVMLTMALKSVSGARAWYERAARYALEAEKAWAAKDGQSGRIRQQCVKALTRSDENPSGLSASAAKDAASDHPTYTTFKDECRKLADAKDDAVVEREVAARGFEAAVVEVKAWVAILYAALASPQVADAGAVPGVYAPDPRD